MRNSRVWIVFLACALGWLVLSLVIAPSTSGEDVYMFRDAGWNLAASGSFEYAAGPYSHDLVPKFYSYYTPIVPLLFAGYASVFPRNAYAGTIFNLLLAFCVAAIALWWVLRQPPGRLRNTLAWSIAVLSPVFNFFTYDRSEAVAFMLFCAAIAYAAKPRPRPVIAGLLMALTFLAHPFAAIVVALWMLALCLAHNWNLSRRWVLTLQQIAVAGMTLLVVIGAVALLYHAIDPTSIGRFAANALGRQSGVGMALHSGSSGGYLHTLRTQVDAFHLIWLLSSCLLAAWTFMHRAELQDAEWLLIGSGLLSSLLAILLIPYQDYYAVFLAFAIPVGLLIWSRPGGRLATPAFAMLIFVIPLSVPALGINLVMRVEQIPSFRAAKKQPAFLRAHLPSPDATVLLNGDFYDLFKPQLHHMVEWGYMDDNRQFDHVDAVVACYRGFAGKAGEVLPFPAESAASDFRLIQAAPQHLWITLFGHRVMRRQWGYGCDLYVRNSPPSNTQTDATGSQGRYISTSP